MLELMNVQLRKNMMIWWNESPWSSTKYLLLWNIRYEHRLGKDIFCLGFIIYYSISYVLICHPSIPTSFLSVTTLNQRQETWPLCRQMCWVLITTPVRAQQCGKLSKWNKNEVYARIQESRQVYESKNLFIKIFEGFLIYLHLFSFNISWWFSSWTKSLLEIEF